MPSHRADTPPDAPVAVLDRPSPHAARSAARTAAHAPVPPRRRDLRAARGGGVQHTSVPVAERAPAPAPARATSPAAGGSRGALDWLDAPVPAAPAASLFEPAASAPALFEPAPAVPTPRRETRQESRQESRREARQELRGDVRPELSWEAPTTVGPPALDPLFLQQPPAAGGEPGAATVQPLRRPRGKDRAQAQTTRRAVQAAAAPSTWRNVSAPQAGIAGALGLATIAVPLCSALGVVPAAQAGEPRTSATVPVEVTALPPFPLVAQPPLNALADRRLLPDETPVADVPAALAAPRVRLTVNGRASRGTDRQLLPGCTGKVPDLDGVQNGRLPASMLCTLWDRDHQLRADAAVAIAKLNVAYTKRFGHPICFNDAYRSLSEQYAIKARRGGYAARPGTSEHGWGLAVDLCDGVDQGPSSPTYAWLRANAPAYGWENPLWARGGGGPYEPWHWEYMPGERA